MGLTLDSAALSQRLNDLKGRVLGNIQRKAITAGTKPIADAEKRLAPQQSKTLRKSIGRKTKIYRNSGIGVGIVGPRSKFTKVIGQTRKGKPIVRQPSRTAHLVERGTKRSRPEPFVGPAVNEAANAATAAMAEKAAEELAKV